MSKQEIIRQAVGVLESLPEAKAQELLNYANYLLVTSARPDNGEVGADALEEAEFRADLAAVVAHSKAYGFLADEPDLYSDDDLIERYK